MTSTIGQIEGLDKLLNKLRRVADDSTYTSAVNKACRIVETTAKKNCTGLFKRPTGNLKASITHEIVKEHGDIAGYVGTNVEYAPYVCFGTGKFAEGGNGRETPWLYEDPKTGELVWTEGQKPKPFLRPALADSAQKVKGAIQDAISKELTRNA